MYWFKMLFLKLWFHFLPCQYQDPTAPMNSWSPVWKYLKCQREVLMISSVFIYHAKCFKCKTINWKLHQLTLSIAAPRPAWQDPCRWNPHFPVNMTSLSISIHKVSGDTFIKSISIGKWYYYRGDNKSIPRWFWCILFSIVQMLCSC